MGASDDHQHVGEVWRVAPPPDAPPLALLLLVDVVLVLDDEQVEGLLWVIAGTVMVRWGMGRNWDGMRGVSWYVLLMELDVSRLRGEAEASRVGVLEWDCSCWWWCGGCCCCWLWWWLCCCG